MDTQQRIAMADELSKIATTYRDAASALSRLEQLEEERPTKERLAHGALAGAVVGPMAAIARESVTGKLPLITAIKARTPGMGGLARAVGTGSLQTLHSLGGTAAGSAVIAAGVPVVRQHISEGAEKKKLREYLDSSSHGALRGQIKSTLGA